jgi:hypothetical protein
MDSMERTSNTARSARRTTGGNGETGALLGGELHTHYTDPKGILEVTRLTPFLSH